MLKLSFNTKARGGPATARRKLIFCSIQSNKKSCAASLGPFSFGSFSFGQAKENERSWGTHCDILQSVLVRAIRFATIELFSGQ